MLVDYGYLNNDHGKYSISDKYVFSRLKNFKDFSKIEYKSIEYHDKIEPVHDEESIRNKLKKYTTVLECHECFVVKYVPE